MTAVTEVEDTPSVQENPTSTVTQSVPITTTSTTTSASSAPGKKSAESELTPYTPAKQSKSRAEMAYAVDALLVKTLQEPPSKSTTGEDNDEDMLFCKSLVPQLKKMPARQNRLAKIKINKLLFDMEFNDERSNN